MKQRLSNTVLVKQFAVFLAVLMTGTAALRAGSRIFPPGAAPRGMTLQQWFVKYWSWYYSGADMSQSRVGKVQLMPLPNGDLISGSFTPEDPALLRGHLEITLDTGTPFVLPEFAWTTEKYLDGTFDPPLSDALVLLGAHPTLTIDGQVVLSDENKAAYYTSVTPFDPIVEYPVPSSYGSVAAIATQGVGVIAKALPEGTHVVHLLEPITIPAGAYAGLPAGWGVIYDNTWTITVKKQKK